MNDAGVVLQRDVDTTKGRLLSPRPRSVRAIRPALAVALLLASGAASRGVAEPLALPLSGLVVDLPGDGWSVASHWQASDDAEVGASGEDVVTAVRDGQVVARYAISAGGRTDRPCPLEHPLPIDLDQVTWIHDPSARTLCHLELDARIEVRIDVGDADPEPHRPVLAALAHALAERAVDPAATPPLHDARVARDAGPELPALTMPYIGLAPTRPDDGYLWRVARAKDGRLFDALVRVFPTFPEVQLLVYRHDASDVPSCRDLARRQVARGPWRVARRPEEPDQPAQPDQIVRRLGRFVIVDRCVATPGGLLDVRVASAPSPSLAQQMAAAEPMLARLAESARTAPLPPLAATVPGREFLFRWATLGSGLALSDVGPTLPTAEVEVGATYARRNGLFARASLKGGVTARGGIATGVVDVGVALGADPELTFVLALGLRDEVDPGFENRSLSGSIELYSGYHRDRAFAWALRVVPFQLVSRQPAVGGAPFALAWDAVFASGLTLGVDLRWIDRPLEPQPGWPGASVFVGVRVGVGDLRH
ncbi:MAG: hypothetical protein U1F43_06100 [Myxococcota bacterium]